MFTIKNEKNILNLPYEECPKDCHDPLWRYSKNPIIVRNPIEGMARIFNSAVVPFKGAFKGIFRAEDRCGIPHLYVGDSNDGLHFTFAKKPITFVNEKGEIVTSNYQYDPRLVEIEGTYYITWCDDFFGPALAIASTKDFITFTKIDHPFLPFNRNGVLFPRKINGKYVLLSRPSDSGHTAFGDIFLSRSPDLHYWGDNEHVMERGYEWWNLTKIGAGANPIETSEGWLLLFHGVTNTCNGFVYSFGAALLDLENPSKVLYRCAPYLLTPETDYETRGFVPNVVFPTSALVDAKTGRIAIYYGGADTVTSICFSTVERLVDYVKANKR
jgi:beta-1,4-mannooligosaccharide/beta-1,4-mannosyl-N-acetylglucosamine phosphorylase